MVNHTSLREFKSLSQESSSNECQNMVNVDKDLKSYLDKEVLTVDFSVSKGEPGLTLELNSGESVWTPVGVMQPRGNMDFETEANCLCTLSSRAY